MSSEIKYPHRVEVLSRADALTHSLAHHNLLKLAQKQGKSPTVDLLDDARSGLPPHAHLTKDNTHVFVFSDTDVLVGHGSGRYVALAAVVVKLSGAFEFNLAEYTQGDPLFEDLIATCTQTRKSCTLTRDVPAQKNDLDPNPLRDSLFRDARAWIRSVAQWMKGFPGQIPPALHMPVEPEQKGAAWDNLTAALKDAIDVAMLSPCKPDNIAKLNASLTLPAPRQDGAPIHLGHRWIASLSSSRLKLPDPGRRQIMDLAEQVLRETALSQMTSLARSVPVWEYDATLPTPGWPWRNIYVHDSDGKLSAHRKLHLQEKYPHLLSLQGA